MARDVIAAYHGTIETRNRESGGALFEITLLVMEGPKTYPEKE